MVGWIKANGLFLPIGQAVLRLSPYALSHRHPVGHPHFIGEWQLGYSHDPD